MRIISGKWKGKRLYSPESHAIRPTSDRAREALFNLLIHLDESPLPNAHVLDLCCGSGALGLEALSRGAAHATFIDNANEAIKLTEQNIASLGATAQSSVLQANASQLPSAKQPVSIVLMDPPYEHRSLVQNAFSCLQEKGWLDENALLCIEQSRKFGPISLPGAEILKERQYGKSVVTIFQIVPNSDSQIDSS